MRYVTRFGVTFAAYLAALFTTGQVAEADVRTEVLRRAALEHGVVPDAPDGSQENPQKVALGERLFQDKRLSLNSDMSCQTCHLDRFSSADGLPNAIGVGGIGEGRDRVGSGGAIVPRNTLPLWGRGGLGFETFFWDGKVEMVDGRVVSQFGAYAPSNDPLVVAAHLPFVEIREMVVDDDTVSRILMHESVDAAEMIYRELVERIRADKDYTAQFSDAFALEPEAITFNHVAEAIAAFIRARFALRDTRFTQFVRGEAAMDADEISGGLIFFGKGRCASCHNGPYFSDLKFYAIPTPQAGFGKNGFGVDYGRFNTTHDPNDLYKFRTPPLLNVADTSPYGHSGWTYELSDAIVAHFDPLRVVDVQGMDAFARHEFYKRLLASSSNIATVGFLDDEEIAQLEKFLRTLSYAE